MASLVTYNCRGYKQDKYAYVAKLAASYDFIFLQEHWLQSKNMSEFNDIVNTSFHACSGMPDDVILQSRPYGGVIILWSSRFNIIVTPYKHFSNCCCAVKVEMSEFTCALICVYLPIDNYSTTATTDLNNMLDLLETFIFSLDVDCVIIGGDCYVDCIRLNAQTTSFNNFCKSI